MSKPSPVRKSRVELRDPDVVMRLPRMGSMHQTRLSFMRALLRRLKDEEWQFERRLWRVDAAGNGVAVYCAHGPERTYSLVCFANDLPPEKRSDRVIATEWDATFTLYDGVPDEADIDRLSLNVPKQEAGRISEKELSLSRANRSVRLFDHVVERLASGKQPDITQIIQVGYLMRTTAVYGAGKFGAADRSKIADRPEFQSSFHMEMLSVWLTRAFTTDIAEHLAKMSAPDTAVPFDKEIRRKLGVGNSTGLGMAPFLVNHPALLHAWMSARENALARVRNQPAATGAQIERFHQTLQRARANVGEWNTDDERQITRIAQLRLDLEKVKKQAYSGIFEHPHPWNALFEWAQDALSLEGQEMMVTLVLEPHGALIDDLAMQMRADEAATFHIDGTMTIADFQEILQSSYAWALETDYSQQSARARFWYVSEEKLEPRLGERFEEDGAELESPLAIGRDAAQLAENLQNFAGDLPLAALLLKHPEHRHIVRRAQIAARLAYTEIRSNLIASNMLPIDLLRCKLAFFGATKFDPRSDRWVRINMYQGAPFPDEFTSREADDWSFPVLEA
jgi:hypothetical protein